MKKNALVGIGNIMFCDDGLGIYAAEYIRQNFHIPPDLDIVDGGTLGFGMMTFYQEYERVFILSTTSEGKSGDVFCFSKEELLEQGTVRQSANEVEVAQMLEICSILDEEMAYVEIVAMKPHDIIPVIADLTEPVKAAFPALIEKSLQTLQKHNIILTPKERCVSLDEVIHAYANPVQPSHTPISEG
ncbi:MAG: Ni/Fe hydrogenase [Sulfurospirillum sp.]|nr:MAG: Ni/Fe hydrogenase [Sulfurospirillum sp.]